jgi:hypothetical protein
METNLPKTVDTQQMVEIRVSMTQKTRRKEDKTMKLMKEVEEA